MSHGTQSTLLYPAIDGFIKYKTVEGLSDNFSFR
jgi:hypothetical protein